MSAQDIVLILGAIGVFVPVATAGIVSIIMAFKANAKLDAASERREVIAQAVLDPNVTTLPPKE